MQTIQLDNTVTIPVVGFGTWQIPDAYESVRYALDVGYRHIDTAQAYGNEESVGKAIKESSVPRQDIFLTTKLGNEHHGYEATKIAFLQSLKKLDTPYVDLYLIHWPNPIFTRDTYKEANWGSWKAMEEFYQMGLVKSIGISNFCERHIETLLERAEIVPQVNQIRLYAGEQQQELVSYCRAKHIVLEAYSPIGTGKLLESEVLRTIAEQVQRSSAQVALRYNLQKGYVVLPKSVTKSRIKENLELFDFSLTDEQMAVLDVIKNICGKTKNPDETSF